MKRGGNLKRTRLNVGAKSLERGSTFASRDSGLKRSGLQPSAITATAPGRRTPVQFKAKVPARTQRCFRCNRQAHSFHHWVAQAHLRAYAGRLGLEEDDERRVLRRLLSDQRNLSPCCQECHWAGEYAPRRLFRQDEIPESAREFAAELGPWAVARLDRINGKGRPADTEVMPADATYWKDSAGRWRWRHGMTAAEKRAWLEANPVPRWPGDASSSGPGR